MLSEEIKNKFIDLCIAHNFSEACYHMADDFARMHGIDPQNPEWFTFVGQVLGCCTVRWLLAQLDPTTVAA